MEKFDRERMLSDKVKLVIKNNRYNLADNKNNILSPMWFDGVFHMRDDYMVVYQEVRIGNNPLIECEHFSKIIYNVIDFNGNLLSPNLWFDNVNNFVDFSTNEGYTFVTLNNKENFMDSKGRLLSDKWFDDITRFNDKGLARVTTEGNDFWINTKGEVFSYWRMEKLN